MKMANDGEKRVYTPKEGGPHYEEAVALYDRVTKEVRDLADRGSKLASVGSAFRIERRLEEENCHAWVLHRSTAEVQRWMEAENVPCLVRGYPHEGVNLPHLDVEECGISEVNPAGRFKMRASPLPWSLRKKRG